MNFHILENDILFARMRIDVVVVGISFTDYMVKLKSFDRSWCKTIIDQNDLSG